MRIGIIGIGNMGRAIAERLAEDGENLTVWNRTAARAMGIPAATVLDTPADVAAASDIVLSVLANDAAIEAAYFGPGGLCTADLTGKTVIEMCTTSPERAKALEKAVNDRGGLFVECPVGGTVGPAREGNLLGLAGGTDAAFDAARHLLDRLTRRLEHLGPVGTGSAMKLAINLPLMVYWSALGEAVALALGQGIDAEQAMDILADSSGAIGAAKKRVPPICHMLETGDPGAANFRLINAIKDMRLMEQLSKDLGRPSPVISATRAKAEAAAEAGWGDFDNSLVGMFGQTRDKAG